MSMASNDPTAQRNSVTSTVHRRGLIHLAGVRTHLAGGATALPRLALGRATVRAGEVTLNIRNRGEIVTFDPHLGSGNSAATIAEKIYSNLVMISPEVPLDPRLRGETRRDRATASRCM